MEKSLVKTHHLKPTKETTTPSNKTDQNISNTTSNVSKSSTGYRCKGTLCQQILIRMTHVLPNIVTSKGKWCTGCQDETEGWKLAALIEKTVLSKPRREIIYLTTFLDTNYTNPKVPLPMFWKTIKPIFKKKFLYTKEYQDSQLTTSGRLREALEIVATTLCLNTSHRCTTWMRNQLTTVPQISRVLELTNNRMGHSRMHLIIKHTQSQNRMHNGLDSLLGVSTTLGTEDTTIYTARGTNSLSNDVMHDFCAAIQLQLTCFSNTNV